MVKDAQPKETASLLLLDDLQPGERARVAAYAEESAYSRELAQLGLIPGTRFEVRRRAPLGDPVEIALRGFSLALRPSEAKCLLLEKL